MTITEHRPRCHLWRTGCLWLAGALLGVAAAAPATDAARTGGADSRALLTPWTTLRGAFIAKPPLALSVPANPLHLSGYLSWLSPTAVTARGNYVYVLDSGRRQIFRYDLTQQNMTPFTDYAAGNVAAIALAPDLSLYVADRQTRQVLHFSIDGRLLRKFGNEFELERPVAVLHDQRSGNLWVADSLYKHVVVFNSLGRVLTVLGSDQARSLEAMAQGPDGLYLLDRLGRQVVVIGPDGADRYTLGHGTLKMPGVLAVDRYNRVWVSDDFDNTLKVYEQGQWVGSVGASGASPASFNQITGLWIDQNMLYVVDRLNARIQTFQLVPPVLKGRAHD